MLRFFRSASALLVLVLAVCLCGVAVASELPVPDDAADDVTPPAVTVETREDGKDITVNVTVVNEQPQALEEVTPATIPDDMDFPMSSETPDVVGAGSDVGVVVRDLVPAQEVSRSPLLDSVSALLGEYQPRTVTVSTYLTDGSVVLSEEPVLGLAGLDWDWLAGVVLFALALYCIFRMIGGLLRWT